MFKFFKKRDENPQVEERAITSASIDSIFSSSVSVTASNSISTAYACVRLLANTVAMTKIKHLETTPRGEEELKTSRLTTLLKNPENNVSYFQWMQNMTNQFTGTGNGYSIIIRDSGSPIELLYVEESNVQIYTTYDSTVPYYYQVTKDTKSFKVAPEDMLHFRNMTIDGFTGLSPLSLHKVTFEAAASINEYNKTFMDNATNVTGILSTDKKLNKETVDELRRNFGKKFGGASNAGKTPVLSEGMQYNQMKVISPMDADYINNRKLNKQDIAEIFGVPLTMLGDVGATYSNAEQLSLIYQRYTVNPMYEMVAQELGTKLIPRHNKSKQRFDFVPESLKLASSKERAETVSLLKNTGIITANESREYYGLPKVQGGDELVDPNNEVGDEAQAPKNTDDTNGSPADPKTDGNINPQDSKRSLPLSKEGIDEEIQRLKSLKGRM